MEQQVVERTQALAESEARFRGLSTSAFEAIIIHDQGRILDSNEAVETLLGYSPDDLKDKPITQLLAETSYEIITQTLEINSEGLYEIEGLTKDGSKLPLEVRTRVVPFQGRHVQVVAARDLTERHQIEAHKQQLATMAERERIGRDLHDDLGQVMGYMSVQAQTVQEYLTQQQSNKAMAALRQLIETANQAHDDVRRYILGVRTDTKPPIDFFEALSRYLEQLRQSYNLDVRTTWPDALRDSPLSAEVETQLLRIIQEALTNVRKHANIDKARILFTLHSDEIQVIISDEGLGFIPSKRTRQTKNRVVPPTAGFGLDIMRERAESVGGTLKIRSEPGQGAQLVVRMPTVLKDSLDTTLQGLRVLLADDHPLYRDGLRNMLTARGIQVVGVARDGLEAQTLARQWMPDLILMDVEMPVCNGLEATRYIKAELPEAKIVMLTVAADDETLFEALKNGASGYLLKNLEGRHFFTLLTEVVRGETVLSPTLAARVLSVFTQPQSPPADETEAFPTLTTRQKEVLALVAQGASNREIAEALTVTERTVKHHISQILERLQLRNRYELAHYAQQQRRSSSNESSPPNIRPNA
ncbi:MAG: response regulator [Chloroflexota bacterium]